MILARLALLVLAGSHAAVAAGDIEKLAWLAGLLEERIREPGSGEQWMPPAGQTMLGTSRTVKRGKTVEFEFMLVRYLEDGTLAYIAQPSGQRTTVFRLQRISDTEAVFENPQHDFPQRVIYARDGETGLRARIEGTRNSAPRVVEFPMPRVGCDAQLGGPAR